MAARISAAGNEKVLSSERLIHCHHLKEEPMTKPCEHLHDLTAADFPPPQTPGACEECLKEGTRWVELRECQACGHVGCCDSSPGKHATKHFHETGHPVMRSVMPGATWTWCYLHEAAGRLGQVASGS
jgi:CPA1 family monovalent cation:H+ antiporter